MSDKLSYSFNPFKLTGIDVPKEKRAEALKDVKDYVKEQVLSYIGDGKSPVANGHWKRTLSPAYKKQKSQTSSATFANLELDGELLDAINTKASKDKIVLEVAGGKDVQAKAEGNQIGSYGREPNKSNSREFIPTNGRTLNQSIMNGVKSILRSYGEDNS